MNFSMSMPQMQTLYRSVCTYFSLDFGINFPKSTSINSNSSFIFRNMRQNRGRLGSLQFRSRLSKKLSIYLNRSSSFSFPLVLAAMMALFFSTICCSTPSCHLTIALLRSSSSFEICGFWTVSSVNMEVNLLRCIETVGYRNLLIITIKGQTKINYPIDNHNLFSLFCWIIFQTLSEKDSGLLNMLGQARTHQKANARIWIRMSTQMNIFKYGLKSEGRKSRKPIIVLALCYRYYNMWRSGEQYDNFITQSINININKTAMHKPAPNPRGPEFQSRRDVRQLTNTQKNLYNNFSIFQLECSRLVKFNHFVQLMEEIRMFNDQLDRWKRNLHDIKNLRITYHLYENLFSRMRYISNFSSSEEESQAALEKTYQWFGEEKPKIRCQVKETPAIMKTYTSDSKESQRIDRMLQSNVVKRELEAYEMMSRTAHPGMFPPKEMLKEYKRKNFLPFSTSQPIENPITVKKSTSASLLSKYKLSKFRMSVGTMATSATSFKQAKQKQSMKNTVTQFKIDNIPEDNKGQENKEEPIKNEAEIKAEQEKMQQLQREANVQKQQIMQGNLAEQLGEEDAADGDEENIYEDEEIKQNKKLYMKDYDPEEIEYAKELAKENQQSTLRRVMKINEEKIRSKLEDLDLERNMMNWGKIKGRMNKEESRKLEGLLNCNKYKDVAYRKKLQSQTHEMPAMKGMSSTTGFNSYKAMKQPVVVPMLYRSKSSNPSSLESQIEKLKIKEVYRAYGKYINHLPIPTTPEEVPEEENDRKGKANGNMAAEVRSMSLTCLASVSKKKNFSNILANNNPHTYNEQVQDEIIRIKTSLSKKGAPIEKGSIYKALSSIPPQQVQTSIGFYTAGRDLLSNPFFPKNLGKKKKKK